MRRDIVEWFRVTAVSIELRGLETGLSLRETSLAEAERMVGPLHSRPGVRFQGAGHLARLVPADARVADLPQLARPAVWEGRIAERRDGVHAARALPGGAREVRLVTRMTFDAIYSGGSFDRVAVSQHAPLLCYLALARRKISKRAEEPATGLRLTRYDDMLPVQRPWGGRVAVLAERSSSVGTNTDDRTVCHPRRSRR
jgi:hypothetical protein